MRTLLCLSFLLLLSTNAIAGTVNPRLVAPGVFRGPRPGSEEAIAKLKADGFKTIINLQGRGMPGQGGERADEIAVSEELAIRYGISYKKLPFATGQDHELDAEERGHIFAAVETLRDPAQQPAYVHCFFGVDRTGVTIATFRILVQGCSFEKARDEMYKVGGFWTPHVTEGQLPFLKEQAARTDRPAESECPL